MNGRGKASYGRIILRKTLKYVGLQHIDEICEDGVKEKEKKALAYSKLVLLCFGSHPHSTFFIPFSGSQSKLRTIPSNNYLWLLRSISSFIHICPFTPLPNRFEFLHILSFFPMLSSLLYFYSRERYPRST